jgi:hypothetical protein
MSPMVWQWLRVICKSWGPFAQEPGNHADDRRAVRFTFLREDYRENPLPLLFVVLCMGAHPNMQDSMFSTTFAHTTSCLMHMFEAAPIRTAAVMQAWHVVEHHGMINPRTLV